jgi:hypothetical protein
MNTTTTRTAKKATPYIPAKSAADVAEEVEGTCQLLGHHALLAILEGRVDAKKVAAQLLAGRGFDKAGNWIGFNAAAALYL